MVKKVQKLPVSVIFIFGSIFNVLSKYFVKMVNDCLKLFSTELFCQEMIN